ncbi:MAG: hypothetical protein WC889_07405 [Myxococcota bacterium]
MKKQCNVATFTVDLRAHPMEAAYGAAYIFLDRYFIRMDRPKKDVLHVTMRAKTGEGDPSTAEGEFHNELLNQSLRQMIAGRNARLREYIIGRALYAADTPVPAAQQSYADDPLGIAVPWEQKYGAGNEG